MALAHHRVVVTATGRVRDGIMAQGHDADRVHACAYASAHACDLTDIAAATVAGFARRHHGRAVRTDWEPLADGGWAGHLREDVAP
ncbi:hypothetical protein ACFYNW_30320 [Streptomyces virginiae]|uniref:hypothetical protein n=1 Tax=Streptomyces virginiae TaxID=1961 RepID=UPI0036E1124B